MNSFGEPQVGENFSIYTHDVTNDNASEKRAVLTSPEMFMITGINEIVRLRFDNGMELRCTPRHQIFTINRGFVEAKDLLVDDDVQLLDVAAPAVDASLTLPVATDPLAYAEKGDSKRELCFPKVWSGEFAHYLGWLIGDGSTSSSTTSTIYGSIEDYNEILPRHVKLIEAINSGRPLKVSELQNGTFQLRLDRRRFKRFLESLGVKSTKDPEQSRAMGD